MKFKMKSSDVTYQLSFVMIKFAGYIFFSVRPTNDWLIEFYQSRLDYFLFVASFVFSIYAASGGGYHTVDFKLRSTILNIGTTILWRASVFSVLVSKIFNAFYIRKVFKIMKDFKWMDREVKPK